MYALTVKRTPTLITLTMKTKPHQKTTYAIQVFCPLGIYSIGLWGKKHFGNIFKTRLRKRVDLFLKNFTVIGEDPDDDDEDDWVDPIIKAKNREGLTRYEVDRWGDLYEINPTE